MLSQQQKKQIQDLGGWSVLPKGLQVVCCDDGLSHIPGVHYLASAAMQRRDYVFGVADKVLRGYPRDVVLTWHRGCGYVAHRLGKVSGEDVDSHYADRVVRIADQFDWQHTELELLRPIEYHPSQYLYYDASGLFYVRDGIPSGFLVSRKWLSASRSMNMTEFITNLATGPHGFRYGGSTGPFTLVAVTSRQASTLAALGMPQMLRELRRVASKFEGVNVQGVEIDVEAIL